MPRDENDWECSQTFNPGVILLNGRVHFIYRAIGKDGISRFGYANSEDGFHVSERLSNPVYEHKADHDPFYIYSLASGGSFGGAEDPRIVQVEGEPILYVTYTACDEGLRLALTSITVEDFLSQKWRWKTPTLISPPGRIHKNWVIFPEKINGKYAILHGISPKIQISLLDNLEITKPITINSYHNGIPSDGWRGGWEGFIRGVGPPPIKTEHGWLVFYHAHSKDDFTKYKLGAMLLDVKNPTRILCRGRKPVLEPVSFYENYGFKPGIVYATGAVVKDGLIIVYYGGADSYVCAAYADLKEFLQALIEEGITSN
ncbi:MAG: hypothetical protein ACKD6M_02680 [Candidatus Bathyarchaeota archaeon]